MTEDQQLIDLHKIFGNRQILTAHEVGELMGMSPKTLWNKRSSGCSLIPSAKRGGKVGFHIRDVSKFLVHGYCETEPLPARDKQVAVVARQRQPRRGLTKDKNWLLALKQTVELNKEMIDFAIVVFEREALRDRAKCRTNKLLKNSEDFKSL